MMEIFCIDCGLKLNKNDKTCPNCGSLKQEIIIDIVDTTTITVHEEIRGKTKKMDLKKPVFEFKQGDSLHKKSGIWNHREMIIDRENNTYKEIIMDKDNNIIHSVKNHFQNILATVVQNTSLINIKKINNPLNLKWGFYEIFGFYDRFF
ncbi:RNA polymerase subunit RPABC4/transcription elongation factor Spt4 [Methanococcus maripaludis]|uniref:RNA polymerase subunit RPABC4/transcription elongation factor Spt4 n=1 Tax=Methanococcus maripaludis TaxID=39152 RepID=A0A7J9S7Z8_METMI|nr:zinc ribbon domain-containing protein [Methanococcus maripaludis]MBB6401984.1 RNA polymerase subunit RPABC4/transcription elongation factor Spt4 [Methanococcus maripaludis]